MTNLNLPAFLRLSTVLTALLALAPADAHAYLDPGTGSMVLQVIVAGVLGAMFTFKSYVRAVVLSITGIFKKRPDVSDS